MDDMQKIINEMKDDADNMFEIDSIDLEAYILRIEQALSNKDKTIECPVCTSTFTIKETDNG